MTAIHVREVAELEQFVPLLQSELATTAVGERDNWRGHIAGALKLRIHLFSI